MKIRQIEKRFQKMKGKNPKKAAQFAFVIAINAKKTGREAKAVEFGRECMALLNVTNPQTMDECATDFTVINGVTLPEFLYQDVLKNRLLPLEI